MAFTFDPIFAADPSNPAVVAASASITIFDPADATKAPITITDPTDSPISNPVTVNKNGFGPAFKHATLDRVGWSGGGFEGFFTSYEGLKAEAVAARTAAETAGASAASAAQQELEERIAAGEFQGEPGPNTVPTNDAIAAAINTAGPTKTALDATYALGGGTSRTITGPALPTLPAGTEYVWNKTDGAGTLLDIVSGVA